MPFNNLAYASERREHRDEVHHRTRAAGPGGTDLPMTIVNLSPNGLMARCESPVEPGAQVVFRFPDLAQVIAEVRWSLGGRVGCEFVQSIAPASYYALLLKLAVSPT